MKKVLWFLLIATVLIHQSYAIVYDSEVLNWPQVIVQIEQAENLVTEELTPSTLCFARVESTSDASLLTLDQLIDFSLPVGSDGESIISIPGIPELISGHYYLIAIPPQGITADYCGPIVHLGGSFESDLLSANETHHEKSAPLCPYARWQSFKWNYTKDTVTFKYYSGLSSSFRSEFDAARDVWNPQSSQYLASGGTTSNRLNTSDGINSLDYTNLGQNGVLARTRIRADLSYHFIETDVEFNFSYPFNTTCASNSHDFRSVAIHELGHVLGLGHVSDSSQVMYPYLSAGQCRRSLGCGDTAGAKAIYGDHIWNWVNSTLGCTLHDATSSGFINGRWKIDPGSTNPYVQFPSKTINQASRYKYVKIVGASNVSITNRKARIYYRCAGQSNWPSDQYKEFTWSTANGVIDVLVSMGTVNASKPWINNQIAQIRLVLPQQANSSERVYLDYLKILNNY